MTSCPADQPRYETSYLGDQHDGQLARLHTLEQAFDPLSIETFVGLHLPEAADILDVGAGSGSLASWLAAHRPQANITATDTDTRFLSQLTDVRILEHDAVRDTFPPACFDVVHARALLSHLRERDDVLARAAEWVRPGGWLVIEDVCLHPSLESSNPLFRAVAEAGVKLLEATVGSDMRWAHTLPDRLRALGLTDVAHQAVLGHIGDGSPADAFWLSTVDQAEPALIQQGFLPQSTLHAMRVLHAQPDFVEPALTMVSTWGRVSIRCRFLT
ncbi:SAM-dependent methyltransferase [Nocardia sp. GAS34]|uniref:class I SAM-dependent methyltransferase n=1 Tax=unclassified Nocardia TaxID=2637762 RepID=UPI003D1B81EF